MADLIEEELQTFSEPKEVGFILALIESCMDLASGLLKSTPPI